MNDILAWPTASYTGTSCSIANVGMQEQHLFIILIFYKAYNYFGYPVCSYLRWNSTDSTVSSRTKWWMLLLEMSATFWRQRGNGAVKVSFEHRMTHMSALLQILICTFCILLPSASSTVLVKVLSSNSLKRGGMPGKWKSCLCELRICSSWKWFIWVFRTKRD